MIILLFIQVIWMESPTNPTLTVIGLAAFMRGRELSTLVVITLAAAGE